MGLGSIARGLSVLTRAVSTTHKPKTDTEGWAVVDTAGSPVTVILESDETSSPRAVSENLVGTVQVGWRVRVEYRGTRLVLTDAPAKGEPSRIPASANLNNYIIPGQYYNPLNVEVAGFTNGPPSNAAGTLVVMRATGEPGGEVGVTQYWHGFDDQGTGSKIYRRRLYNASWSAWKLMNPASWVGSVSGGQRSGVTYYNVTLNFPSGLFSTAPKVFAQINNQAGGSHQLQVMTGNITASSCLVGFFMTTGTMNNHWCEADVFAIEPS